LRKRLTATLLLGGHLLFAFPPVAALATPAPPAGPPATGSDHALSYDDHYRCMYHCAERGYGRDDRYRQDRYGYDRYRSDRDRSDRYRHDNRVYHNGECWYHDDGGWHRCGYRRYRYDGGPYSGGYGYDSRGSGYDSHRHHPRDG